MTDNARTILHGALAMPLHDRAHIAAELIASLDEEREGADEVAAAWAHELARRARQTLRDPSSAEDWNRLRDRIADRLASE